MDDGCRAERKEIERMELIGNECIRGDEEHSEIILFIFNISSSISNNVCKNNSCSAFS